MILSNLYLFYMKDMNRELIDGMEDDNYVAVLNCIDVIDEML